MEEEFIKGKREELDFLESCHRKFEVLNHFLREVEKIIHNYDTGNNDKLNEIARKYKDAIIGLNLV